MKKTKQLPEDQNDDVKDLEILKAVAQAWHAHSGSIKPTNEFDAYRRNSKVYQQSRFRTEAMTMDGKNKRLMLPPGKGSTGDRLNNWDFGESLWDSYEIVSVAKKLEAELVLDGNGSGGGCDGGDLFSGLCTGFGGFGKKKELPQRRESENSLRNLINRASSRRFSEGAG